MATRLQVLAEAVRLATSSASGRVTKLSTPLPKCELRLEELGAPYTLQGHLLPGSGLTGQQWAAFSEWETADLNVDRAGPPTKDSAGSLKAARDFLGYLRRHHDSMAPNLDLFLKGHLIAEYVAFKRARDCAPSTIATSLKGIKKLVAWHGSRCATAEAGSVQALLGDLSTLVNNFDRLTPGPASAAKHEADGKWLDESKLVEVLTHLEKRALAAAGSGRRTRTEAQLVMDAVLTGFAFLHLPPQRPMVMRLMEVRLQP